MKERLVYIDVIRGLAMFTVVYSHLLLFSLDVDSSSWIVSFLRLFFLRGFFFISGYMAFKLINWSLKETIAYVSTKAKYLLIPTLVCGGIFMLTHGISLSDFMLSGSKCGYWFTYTLFLMFVLYAIIMLCLNKLKKDYLKFALLAVVGLLAIPLSRSSLVVGEAQDFFTLQNFLFYFPYFVLGILCKRYSAFFNGCLMESRWMRVLLALVVFLSYFSPLLLKLSGVFAVLLVYYIAKSLGENKEYAQSVPMRLLSYLGKHTIEIYFLHYFLLFPLPLVIKNYLEGLKVVETHVLSSGLSLPEFLIVGSLAICICYVCIGLSVILKQLPYMNWLLFGKKA